MPKDKPGRGRIYDSITETIGDTPLVRMTRMPKEAGVKADILLKLEFFNPLASVKDRIEGGDDRGAGKKQHHHARQKHLGRAHIGQYRHCARLCRRRQGNYRLILVMPGIHVAGTAQDAADPGGRDRTDRSLQGDERRHRPRP